MPVGQKDKRRGGHRCIRCRTSHLKCDGLKPCTPCARQGLLCSEASSPSTSIQLIEYRAHSAHPPRQTISSPLVLDEWSYICVFFNAIGSSSSPMFHAFHIEKIGHLVHSDSRVYNAVATTGATYSQRNSALTSPSPAQNSELKRATSRLRTATNKAIKQNVLLDESPLFLCAMLLGFIELMTDESANRWRSMVRQIWAQVSTHHMPLPDRSSLSRQLLRFLRLSNALGTLLFHEDERDEAKKAGEENAETELTPVRVTFDVQLPTTALLPPDKFDALVRILEDWAMLQKLSDELLAHMTAESDTQAELSPTDPIVLSPIRPLTSTPSLHGLQIIRLASSLQTEIVHTMLLPSLPATITPYYHWILAGLSSMFLSSAWLSLGWHLPVMGQSLLYEQAIAALEIASKSVENAGLDAAFYLPIVPFIGREMRYEGDRRRAIEFIRAIAGKGFVVARNLEEAIKEFWLGQGREGEGEGEGERFGFRGEVF